MISYKYKFIFIHIPKTGGNSIQNLLNNYSEDLMCSYNIRDDFSVVNRKLETHKHSGVKEYYSALGEKEFKKYFVFTSVRNPWERAISFYTFLHNHPPSNIGLLRYLITRKVSPINKYLSLNGRYSVDYVIRFENLQEDFNKVCDKIGIPRQKLPHVTKSKHNNYTEYYNPITSNVVETLFREEIKHFDYKIDGLLDINKKTWFLKSVLFIIFKNIFYGEYIINKALRKLKKYLRNKSKMGSFLDF